MNSEWIPTKTLYEDHRGEWHNSEVEAIRANHNISLLVRKYLEKIIVQFSDGGIDMLATTNNLWNYLEMPKAFIDEICCIMEDLNEE